MEDPLRQIVCRLVAEVNLELGDSGTGLCLYEPGCLVFVTACGRIYTVEIGSARDEIIR